MVSGNVVTLLHDGEQVFPAMLDAIRGASREILLEMYWFGSDATGTRFADALIENYIPPGMRERGLDYDSLAAVNPNLVDARRAAQD